MTRIPEDLRRLFVSTVGALAVSALCVFGAVGPAYAADTAAPVAAAVAVR